jgi:hypothetical protein
VPSGTAQQAFYVAACQPKLGAPARETAARPEPPRRFPHRALGYTARIASLPLTG